MGFAALIPLVAAVAAPIIAKKFGPKPPKPPKFQAPPEAEEAKTPKFADPSQRQATIKRRQQSLRSSTLLGGGQKGLLDDSASTTGASLLS